MPFVGRYINMDASVERREAMEAQFLRLGCQDRYSRFPGVDGRTLDLSRSRLSPGELGCFMAHYQCIVDSDVADHHVHIIEDDVVFSPQTVFLIDRVVDDAASRCDLLFTDIFVPLHMTAIYDLMAAFRASQMSDKRLEPPETRLPAYVMYPSLRTIPYGGATSYIVNRASREKIIALLDEEIANGPNHPIDMVFRILTNEGRLDALCTMPFLTSIEADSICDSTIIGRDQHADSAMAFYALRSFFYVARDDEKLMALAGRINRGLKDPAYLDLMLQVFKFAFSDQFAVF